MLSVVSCRDRCETWSVILWEEYQFGVFKNKDLRRIFRSKKCGNKRLG
jgi:hypothetical protein